jgi:hypothetical protein
LNEDESVDEGLVPRAPCDVEIMFSGLLLVVL